MGPVEVLWDGDGVTPGPLPLWTDRRLWKYLPVVLRTRAVKIGRGRPLHPSRSATDYTQLQWHHHCLLAYHRVCNFLLYHDYGYSEYFTFIQFVLSSNEQIHTFLIKIDKCSMPRTFEHVERLIRSRSTMITTSMFNVTFVEVTQ